ncbi:MAG: poly-gamma-glutamate system protein [Spirochaetae bacterium HGW-Spirochaetae-9]|nr:MAG: poly-gamma-glutamate system protein [Spirochaetae bacterium HGW-Spirochaetae-9]
MARLFRPFVRSRAGTSWLIAALAVACLGFALSLATRTKAPYPLKETQLRAARLMAEAEARLKESILAENIPIEADLDPNGTGLIGPEWTALTTTLGTLEAKRTSLNPNFAALMVRWFHEAGLSAGDLIAVGASGSFPGLTIATLCAAREMGLEALTIASFGSSMYGATRHEFTTPKMIRILADSSLIPWSLVAVSPGSDFDHGESLLFDDAREIIARLALETGVEFIDFDEPDLESSIARRLEIFDEKAGKKKIKCFVNIGGASPNSGVTSYTLDFPQGLVLEPPRIPVGADRGLIYEFASRGVPIINLLNLRLLAYSHGLPYDPIPLPPAGEGSVYEDLRYNKAIIFLTLCAIVWCLALSRRRNVL